MKSDLHVVELGAGEPIVFVHGSFGWGEESFPNQRELADGYRVVLVDRRGYGDSPPADRVDFDSLTADVCAVIGAGAYLVGHSYGGLLCLLAAARHPDAAWSLTVIEPPAYSIARGDPAVETSVERLAAFFDQADPTAPDQIFPDFMVALDFDRPQVEPTAKDLAASLTTIREPPPSEAQVPLGLLAATPFPKLVAPCTTRSARQAVQRSAPPLRRRRPRPLT